MSVMTREIISVLLLLAVLAALYTGEFLLLAVYALRKIKHKNTNRLLTRKPALLLHALALIGILCFLYARFIEPCWLEVKTITITTPKLTHSAIRIIQISDLHCDNKLRTEEKLVQIINSLHPDIIVFTGDSLNTASALPLFRQTMHNLNAKIAKLAVRGNFEARYWKKLDLFTGTGFEPLDADTVQLHNNGDTIYVTGLDCGNNLSPDSLLAALDPNCFSIFLYHKPDLIEDVNTARVDLYLCGHTHGGQVALPFYGALITLSKHGKKYEAGLYKVKNTLLYVNRGIGLERRPAPQVRFFARPEITLFEIQPASNPKL